MRHELIHAFLYISIHAPTRGATKWIPCCGQSAHISIHAPARGATNSASMMSALSLFQSTLPQGERRLSIKVSATSLYFNPRSHKGSDSRFQRAIWRRSISIHAPTRGATWINNIFVSVYIISIHAPTRGATNTCVCLDLLQLISIHAPTRGATRCVSSCGLQSGISIHAPTRGATIRIIHTIPRSEHFNPRSHKGSDGVTGSLDYVLRIFQSTLPQGERRHYIGQIVLDPRISIHAPTRGATAFIIHFLTSYSNFNPRSHKGSDIHQVSCSLV